MHYITQQTNVELRLNYSNVNFTVDLQTKVVKKSDMIVVHGRARAIGRSKLTLDAVIHKDLGLPNRIEQIDMAQ